MYEKTVSLIEHKHISLEQWAHNSDQEQMKKSGKLDRYQIVLIKCRGKSGGSLCNAAI